MRAGLFAVLLLRNTRTTDSLRPGRMGEFLARWCRACAACALLSSCTPVPQWYSMPSQRTGRPETEPVGVGSFMAFGDRTAPEYIVADILPGSGKEVWRWTNQKPTLKFVVMETARWAFQATFALPEATWKQTGPVTLRVFVNEQLIATAANLPAGRHELRWPVPVGLLKANFETVVRLELDKVFIAEADQARLGMILESAGFVR